MKIAVFGHSYVRDIARVGKEFLELKGHNLTIKYFAFPGATFEKFVLRADLLDPLITYDPLVVVLVLGGNDFYNNTNNKTIYDNYECVVAYLKRKLPSVSLIPCQIEKRFLEINNRWNSSDTALFQKRRSAYNRKLNKCPYKSCILRVQGPGRLDCRSNYAYDGIHLSNKGLGTYWAFLVSTLDYFLLSVYNG